MAGNETWQARIDQNLNELNKAVVTLARVDERVANFVESFKKSEERTDACFSDLFNRVRALEGTVGTTKSVWERIEKVLWPVVVVVLLAWIGLR